MSAKGRKRKDAPATEVADFEFYPTPPEAIDSLLESHLVDLPGGAWIDPCAGTGRIPRTVNAYRRDVRWILCEIDERHRDTLNAIARPGDVLLPFADGGTDATEYAWFVWPDGLKRRFGRTAMLDLPRQRSLFEVAP